MDVAVKETMYVSINGKEYVVRQETKGVQRGQVIYFYDATKTVAIGFDKNFCVNTKTMFQVARTMDEREVSIKHVLAILEQDGSSVALHTIEKLKSL